MLKGKKKVKLVEPEVVKEVVKVAPLEVDLSGLGQEKLAEVVAKLNEVIKFINL